MARIVAVEKPFTGYRLTWKVGPAPAIGETLMGILFFVAWFLIGAIAYLGQPVERPYQQRTQSNEFETLFGIPRGRR